ncbi:uncharacterized protein PFL1_03728 [Pseudozyma flocculosa PF-1]|uniref:Uncharacterized protein n=2 Tax=Pseudozyma flocculosa TaxID=84751 RepID=A0A5C3F238_9BASI|nr:uncharacterized protein PFL1_03728 [Pseudozyma flocculosa PF-1]EPQ28928.1 hypothetical protein PFL1_03728 [Pseudozyma flocculosa PF-1]SPO38583.1 uncharacterized protein PSFLO_04061 [Pseudozyma flocculosa]
MSDREPLLPTHARNAREDIAEYGTQLKHDAKKTARQYGVDPNDPVGQAREAAPSRESLVKLAKVIGAVRAGKMPSQQQLSSWIESVINSPVLDERNVPGSSQLSQQGARVLQDLKGVLACVERVAESKNGDNKIQKFFYQTSQASVGLRGEGGVSYNLPSTSSVGADGLGSEAKDDAKQVLHNVQQIGQLFVTSKPFRNLVADIQFLLRDLTADAASQAARKAGQAEGKIRPSERERQARGDAIDIKAPSREDVKSAADRAKSSAQQATKDAKGSLQDAAKWVDEKTSDDAKDEFIERIREVVGQVQEDPDFKRALNGIYSIGNKWIDIVQDVAEKAKEQTDVDIDTPEAEANANFRESVELLQNILEEFSGRSLKPVKEAFGKFSDHVKAVYDKEASKETKELREFIDDVKAFIDRSLNQDGYIQSNRANREASDLYDRAQTMLKASGKDANKELNKLKSDFDEVLDEISNFAEGFEEDPELRELGQRVEKLADDVNFLKLRESFGKGGSGIGGFVNTIRTDAGILVRDTVEVIIPRMIQQIQEIPFPRLEFSSPEADVVIDDLSFRASTASFVPDSIRIVNRNDLSLSQRRNTYGSNVDSSLYLEVTGLRIKAADVAYYIKKKTGWFGWEDYGFLDLDLGGRDGTSFVVKLHNADEDDEESYFRVDKVSVDMSHLAIKVRQTRHWFLNFFLMPFVRPVVRKTLQHLLESQIQSWLQNADRSLWATQQRAKVINSYSKTALKSGQGVSMKAYTKAIFAPEDDAFSPYGRAAKSKPKTDVGLAQGVLVEGPHGDFKLAIGASHSRQLFPGKGGPARHAERKEQQYEELERTIREGVEQAKQSVEEVREGAREAVEQVREGVEGLEGDAKKTSKQAKGEAQKLSREARNQQRKERLESGWKSDVFDIDL